MHIVKQDAESKGTELDCHQPSLESLQELLQLAFSNGLDFSYSHKEQRCRLTRPPAGPLLVAENRSAQDESIFGNFSHPTRYLHHGHGSRAILSPVPGDDPVKPSSA